MGKRHGWSLVARTVVLIATASWIADDAKAQERPSRDQWDVQSARGKTRTIDFTTTEGTWMNVDVSPDGRMLVFDLLGHVYRLPVSGGDAEVLTGYSGVAINVHPAFSPDGKHIAFISDRAGQNNLWVMNSDGSAPRILEQNLGVRHSLPQWTPDGRFIVARRTTLGDARRLQELWLYHLDGGRGTALTRQADHGAAGEPAVSADGRFVFFTTDVPDVEDPAKGRTQLRRLDLEFGDVLKVTEGSERGPGGDARMSSGGGFTPRPSPDGKWLAFGRRLASGTISFKGRQLGPRTALWVRNMETGAERLLIDPVERDLSDRGSEWSGYLPRYAWAPDGSSIFLAQGGGLKKLDVTTGTIEKIPFRARVHRVISEMAYKQVPLERAPLNVRFLRWPALSPDGRTLVFQAVGRLWIQDLPDGPPRPVLAKGFTAHQYAPAFSHDGQHIAFTTWNDDERGHVWTVPVVGGQPRRISQEAGEYLNPVWAPDGKQLVVVAGSGATARGQMLAENAWYALRIMPVTGGPGRHLVDVNPPSGRLSHRRHIVQPSFGPEGRVYYPEMLAPPGSTEYRTEIRSIRTDGLDRRTHIVLPATDEAALSPDGQWLAFEEGDNVFLTALPLHGVGGRAVELKREDKPLWGIRPLSTEGGNFPRWAAPGRLVFGSATRVFTHDVATGKTETHTVSLQVPRSTAAGTVVLRNARLLTMGEGGVIPGAT
jgi:Tol biopolymer transport system component